MITMLEKLQRDGVPLSLFPDFMMERIARAHNAAFLTDETTPWEDWSLKTKWKPELYLRASTYDPFPGPYRNLPAQHKDGLRFGNWGLYAPVLPKAAKLRTHQKNGDRQAKLGWVQFDGDVYIPSLHRVMTMVMGLSPMECISVKVGATHARGHTVITGLGLGYLLWLCSHRKQVKKITVIEIDMDLTHTIWPMISSFLGPVPVRIVQGDCMERLLKLRGDALLADHFDGFGGNGDWFLYNIKLRDHIRKNFKHIWTWG